MNDKRTPNTTSWVSVEAALPEVKIDKQEKCNGVLVYLRGEPDGGFRYMVSNTEFVRRHPEQFLYWMYLPPVPEKTANKRRTDEKKD